LTYEFEPKNNLLKNSIGKH